MVHFGSNVLQLCLPLVLRAWEFMGAKYEPAMLVLARVDIPLVFIFWLKT